MGIAYETERFVVREHGGRLVGEERVHRVAKSDRRVVVQDIGGDLYAAVARAFETIGAGDVLPAGARVAVKINIGGGIRGVLPTYSDPAICAAIVRQIRRLGGVPFLCEADMRARPITERTLRQRGYGPLLDDTPFVNLTQERWVSMRCRDCDVPLALPEILFAPDVRIVSFAPPKPHWECGFTGSQKNMYGAIADWRKSRYHRKYRRIDAVVAAAARILAPDLNILATFDFCAGPGPHFGAPAPFHHMIVAPDMLACDKAMCDMMGYPFDCVRYATMNAQGGAVDYQLVDGSDLPDDSVLAGVRAGTLHPRQVRRWKAALYLQYFVPHRFQVAAYPPLEFLATAANRVLFPTRDV